MSKALEETRQRHVRAFQAWDDDGMSRWVRSYWDEEDITYVWEIGDDGWVTRSVELIGAERRPQTAAALDEVIRERDTGSIQAVRAYEARCGVLVEKPIDDWAFPHEDVTQAGFERVWADARRALTARW
jgi:hypothetical protein